MVIGALEAGGTKMVCAIGDEKGHIYEQQSFPTLTPKETIPELIEFFKNKNIELLGIGSFGPVDVNKTSATYGHILDTPKTPWKNYDMVGVFEEALKVPVGIDTDVNGSCLGEVRNGQAKGLNSVVYITIGTGVGAGMYINGGLVHGMLHPEAGHILINRQPGDTTANCPYHKDCLEGVAAGPAIEKRWGKKAVELKDNMEVWELESEYIAQALMNYILVLSPEKIILGGGVMHQEQLFPMIRTKVVDKLAGYLNTIEIKDIDNYIVPASLGDDQGIIGAIHIGLNSVE